MKSIEEIGREKEALRKKLRELERMEAFKESCSYFKYTNTLGDAITKLINSKEDKKYICTTIKKTFQGKGHYESTGYYEDDPSGCGGGWVSTGERYVVDPDTTLEYVVIMEQDIFDLFNKLKFTSIEDFQENLRVLTSQGKQVSVPKHSFTAEKISSHFSYVGEFFRQLAEERYEQGKLDIDIMSSLNQFLKNSSKLSKTPKKPKQS